MAAITIPRPNPQLNQLCRKMHYSQEQTPGPLWKMLGESAKVKGYQLELIIALPNLTKPAGNCLQFESRGGGALYAIYKLYTRISPLSSFNKPVLIRLYSLLLKQAHSVIFITIKMREMSRMDVKVISVTHQQSLNQNPENNKYIISYKILLISLSSA